MGLPKNDIGFSPNVLPFLRIYDGSTFLRSYRLEDGVHVLGRDSQQAQILILDPKVSRKHAQIECSGKKLTIQDLNSSNGTFVNGERVLRTSLQHRDEIRIGNVRVIVSFPPARNADVIPFPRIRTDPGIELSSLESKLERHPGLQPETPQEPKEISELEGWINEEMESLVARMEQDPEKVEAPSRKTKVLEDFSKEAFEPKEVEEDFVEVAPTPQKPPLEEKRGKSQKWAVTAMMLSVSLTVSILLAWNLYKIVFRNEIPGWVSKTKSMTQRIGFPFASGSRAPKDTERQEDLVERKSLSTTSKMTEKPKEKRSLQSSRDFKTRETETAQKNTPKSPVPELHSKNQSVAKVPSENSQRTKSHASKTVVKSVQDSLSKLSLGDVLETDRMRSSDSKRVARSSRSLDSFSDFVEVDIELPTSEDRLRENQKESTSKKATRYDPIEYRKLLRNRLTGIESCYVTFESSGRRGAVSLDLAIGKNGRALSSKVVKDSFRNSKLAGCMESFGKKIEAPSPPWAPFYVTFSFRFGARRIEF